jgi:hypothetical protein
MREAGQVFPPPVFPSRGPGQSDGGRPAGRVLACLYNPGKQKKVPAKRKKMTNISGKAHFWEDLTASSRM